MGSRLNIDGISVNISFNIKGNDHLKRKLMEFFSAGIPFEMKTSVNGESYFINPELLASMHIPSREVTKHETIDQLQYQVGIAFMFCTEIIPMPKTLTLKEQQLLEECHTTL